ncbi:fumarylacetoacetate hydrolase family protein [Demequina sp. SYSU T00039]|uniref:Fumarylacetoacetate hydrolase family protein n=1 Tax=Demequina lignilytica TaxID=3051663 RepID=A0AAW7MA22_9MICO|nr:MULTISPECIES: fumarylacetoacetate hydrolase family protein [unclassified Demequina]MDN4479177.1 fumarylacetoacetate hydrolase family protein [Demequina sp. SYSU T00039-1]MDN4489110.1 fumarylacetoacetate hydrolase family protein [Demequina sp. SYSU T00039]
MRLARWSADGTVEEGVIRDDAAVPFGAGRTVADALAAGLDRLEEVAGWADAAGARPLAGVQLMVPVAAPSVRDFVAFEEHVEGVSAAIDGASEVVAEWYELPTFYFTNPHTLRADGAVVRPPVSARLDFELEVAAVIGGVDGSDGRDLDVETAKRHIVGYTIMNDWSARDVQGREMKVRLGPCKGKDFATSLGPWIVTADELTPYEDADGFLALEVEAWVRGERIGHDLLSNMGWPFAELAAYASRDSRIVPGDVLGSGTAGNGGCLAELWGRTGGLAPEPLRPGDTVVLRVEGIGELRGTVGTPQAPVALPAARTRPRVRSR